MEINKSKSTKSNKSSTKNNYVGGFLNWFSSKKTKKQKMNMNNTKKNEGKNKQKELCKKKYFGKSVRGTPINWAYKRCVKGPSWERCKNLPPAGYGMHRYFCE